MNSTLRKQHFKKKKNSDLEQQRPFGAFPPSWQRPSRCRFKCNTDAAFSNKRNITGLGMCIRDEGGVFVIPTKH